MKKTFIFKFVCILATFVLLFQLSFGFLLPLLLVHSGDSTMQRWYNFFRHPVDAELVILGSSRVHRHFDPSVIETKTGMKTEDIATGGALFNFLEALYKDYLKLNKSPKVFIFGLDLSGLYNSDLVPNPEFFFQGMLPSSSISQLPAFQLVNTPRSFGYFYYKEFYFNAIVNPEKNTFYKGFEACDLKWGEVKDPGSGEVLENFSFGIDPILIDRIMKFISKQAENGSQSFAVIAPEFNSVWKFESNRNEAVEEVYSIAKKYKVRIINFSDTSYKVNFDKNYFYNTQHLNAKGATLFSKDFCDSLAKYVKR